MHFNFMVLLFYQTSPTPSSFGGYHVRVLLDSLFVLHNFNLDDLVAVCSIFFFAWSNFHSRGIQPWFWKGFSPSEMSPKLLACNFCAQNTLQDSITSSITNFHRNQCNSLVRMIFVQLGSHSASLCVVSSMPAGV